MFEAQYFFEPDSIFSPWMSRGGDNAIFTMDVVAYSGTGAQLQASVFTKNRNEAGDGTFVNKLKGSSLGRTILELDGLKELVRYKFDMIDTTDKDSRALFRMLDVVWFDDLNASGAS